MTFHFSEDTCPLSYFAPAVLPVAFLLWGFGERKPRGLSSFKDFSWSSTEPGSVRWSPQDEKGEFRGVGQSKNRPLFGGSTDPKKSVSYQLTPLSPAIRTAYLPSALITTYSQSAAIPAYLPSAFITTYSQSAAIPAYLPSAAIVAHLPSAATCHPPPPAIRCHAIRLIVMSISAQA